ncbi:MAG: hypothetical protein R6W91_01175, partial [Thermoplasmata archaeon]
MKRLISIWLVAILITTALVIGVYAQQSQTADKQISGTGTIVWRQILDFRGYLLITDNGETYAPMHLPDEFKVDGYRLLFAGTVSPNWISLSGYDVILIGLFAPIDYETVCIRPNEQPTT